MQLLSMFGPVDTFVAPVIEYVVLALVLVNMGTRLFAYRDYRSQAREDDREEYLDRNYLHELSNLVLVLGSFYLLTLHHHAGMVMSTLVLGLFLTDFFEFEAREVELRNGERLSKPNGALVAWALVLLYAAYQSLFYVIAPFWNSIV
ncbi:hypothetical protein NGM10_03085 [Halorussus salilacus]|uniref:DUF7313 family protein n=1 Tax=Halorussus salilacus TaxID=2953750 RepID=UPI00209C93D3|nr:hypothetical protein [Halorussus salilacus]USZ68730.1 hypothetical protein NGM10_03085 [Halorussus salilacus]